jgi:DNA-binding MarR family transcriptional regulator
MLEVAPMSSARPSHPTAHLSYWLRYASNHVSHAFSTHLTREGVTVAEWAVLGNLFGNEGIAPNRLAHRLGLTPGAISKLADRLKEKDLVLREEHSSDGRTHTLTLTEKGKALVPRLAAIADRHDVDYFSHLSIEDRKTLERMLKEVVERRALRPIPVTQP